MKSLFNLVLFTASTHDYAIKILQFLEQDEKYFGTLLSREHCSNLDGNYVKDLRVIQNVVVDDIIIIDNLISSFALQLSNGIPIKPYFSGSNDSEL